MAVENQDFLKTWEKKYLLSTIYLQLIHRFTESICTTGAAHHSTGTSTHLHTKLYTPPPPPNTGVRLSMKSKV